MSLRITALIYMACFAALSMGLYLVKYSVQNIQRDVESARNELAQEKESLHLLKAEWAYLNRPDRLQRLAGKHLDLVPLDSKRINDVSVLPAAATHERDGPSFDGLFQPVNQMTVEER
jgi:cell division protein FtsL